VRKAGWWPRPVLFKVGRNGAQWRGVWYGGNKERGAARWQVTRAHALPGGEPCGLGGTTWEGTRG
jgi:hypothetical protein